MAVYICTKCLFCFERSGEVEICEECGHPNVRYATEKEIAEYLRIKAELNAEQKERDLRLQ